MRGAQRFNDNPLARASAGSVQGKLLEMQVDNATVSASRAARATKDPTLQR